jgi:hypothetical protein
MTNALICWKCGASLAELPLPLDRYQLSAPMTTNYWSRRLPMMALHTSDPDRKASSWNPYPK